MVTSGVATELQSSNYVLALIWAFPSNYVQCLKDSLPVWYWSSFGQETAVNSPGDTLDGEVFGEGRCSLHA